MMRHWVWLCALLLTAIGGLCPIQAGEAASNDLDALRQLNRSFVELAQKVSPSVVVINVVQRESPASLQDAEDENQTDGMPPGFWKKFHEQFKRLPVEKTIGQGSGIVVRSNGYILTNGHVIEDAESISVQTQDGKTYKASVRGIDSQSDVAIIKIEATNLAVARLGDSDRTRVGELAVAIGAPYGFDYSVTFGHISAKSRSNLIDSFDGGYAKDQDFIQTDALINPGNSGGPLVNIEGDVIGINTLIQGLHTGIGFAIPSNLAKEVSDQLINSGRFMRPYLGIGMKAVRDEVELRQLIQGVQEGVVVRSIYTNGPAAKSSLKPSDIITAIDGQPVATAQQFRSIIRGKKIGVPVTFDVYRQGQTIPIQVRPIEWPEQAPMVAVSKSAVEPKTERMELGMTVKPLTPALASQLGAGSTEGVVVATVEKNSLAARNRIRPGDIVTSVNQQPVGSRKQFEAAMEKADLKKGVLLNLVSGSTARFEILKAQ